MTIASPMSLRWERAQHFDRSAIEPLGYRWYIVPSSRDPTGYAVHIEFEPAGPLVQTRPRPLLWSRCNALSSDKCVAPV
jgi:hypothetical protein